MAKEKAKEITKKGENIIADADMLIRKKREELDEKMANGKKQLVDKGQQALGEIEKAVGELSDKLEAYKRGERADNQGRRNTLKAVGAAAAVVATIIGIKKFRDSRKKDK